MKPIALFGLSGVGKTTLAHELVKIAPNRFSIIPITASRTPRGDDDPSYIEFVSKADFVSATAQGCFAMWWEQDGNHYGYRREYFENIPTHPILTCSLSAIQLVKQYGAVTILINGDSSKGLEARGSDEITKKRRLLNVKNTSLYLNQPWFKEKVDINHNQVWGNLPLSAQQLYESIEKALSKGCVEKF